MKRIAYILLLSLFTACGKDNCNDTFYLSDKEKAFIAYNFNDSIKVNYISKTSNELSWENVFKTTFSLNDTVKEDDPLGTDLCADHFERCIVELYSSNYLSNIVTKEGHDYIWFRITSENGVFNTLIRFNNPNYSYLMASKFSFSPLKINDKTVYFTDEKDIDACTYKNVYTMIDTNKEYFDTLYYSPNYGLIKLITETGTYTFENFN